MKYPNVLLSYPMTDKTIRITAEREPTPNEIELVASLGDDLRPKEIAGIAKIPQKTVEARLYTLKHKFGCRTNSGLVALFFRNKLIT